MKKFLSLAMTLAMLALIVLPMSKVSAFVGNNIQTLFETNYESMAQDVAITASTTLPGSSRIKATINPIVGGPITPVFDQSLGEKVLSLSPKASSAQNIVIDTIANNVALHNNQEYIETNYFIPSGALTNAPVYIQPYNADGTVLAIYLLEIRTEGITDFIKGTGVYYDSIPSCYDKWLKLNITLDYLASTFSSSITIDGTTYKLADNASFPTSTNGARLRDGGISKLRFAYNSAATHTPSTFIKVGKLKWSHNSPLEGVSVPYTYLAGTSFDDDNVSIGSTSSAVTAYGSMFYNKNTTNTFATVAGAVVGRSGKVLKETITTTSNKYLHLECGNLTLKPAPIPLSGVIIAECDYNISPNSLDMQNTASNVYFQVFSFMGVVYNICADGSIKNGAKTVTYSQPDTIVFGEWISLKVIMDFDTGFYSIVLVQDGIATTIASNLTIDSRMYTAGIEKIRTSFVSTNDNAVMYIDNFNVVQINKEAFRYSDLNNLAILGDYSVGNTLTAIWEGTGDQTVATNRKTKQWYRGYSNTAYTTNGMTAIDGATGDTYTLTEADKNCFITFKYSIKNEKLGWPDYILQTKPSPINFIGGGMFKETFEDLPTDTQLTGTSNTFYSDNIKAMYTTNFTGTIAGRADGKGKAVRIEGLAAEGIPYGTGEFFLVEPLNYFGDFNTDIIKLSSEFNLTSSLDGTSTIGNNWGYMQIITGVAGAGSENFLPIQFIQGNIVNNAGTVLCVQPIGEWFAISIKIHITEKTYDVVINRSNGEQQLVYTNFVIPTNVANLLDAYGVRNARVAFKGNSTMTQGMEAYVDNFKVLKLTSENVQAPVIQIVGGKPVATANIAAYDGFDTGVTLVLAVYSESGLKLEDIAVDVFSKYDIDTALTSELNMVLSSGNVVKAFLFRNFEGIQTITALTTIPVQ